MQPTTVLFDLDGTLLPMDYHGFVRLYFHELTKKFTPPGGDPKKLTDSLWAGVAAMAGNDGSRTNADLFWEVFSQQMGRDMTAQMAEFDAFYVGEFNAAFAACGENPAARTLIDALHAKGVRVVLATNPQFPLCAVQTRLGWIGLRSDDFAHVTTYENSHFTKPSPSYYTEILDLLGLTAGECIMVGNDVREDIVPTASLGMRNYLVTDWILGDIAQAGDAPRGSFAEMADWLLKFF